MRSATGPRPNPGTRAVAPSARAIVWGCAARVHGDVVVDVPPESQVHRQVVRKDLDLPATTIDPLFTLWYVEIIRPELGDDASLADLVREAVAEQHGRTAPSVPLRALSMLQPAVHQGDGAITVVIDDHDDVVAVWPGFVDEAYGVAVDIGSTTIAGHLCDLTTGEVLASAGRMNPQIRYGEDLMSRVSYVMMNPGGDRDLTESVRTALDGLIGELVDQAQTFREYVLEVVLVGNPIMHHVVLGLRSDAARRGAVHPHHESGTDDARRRSRPDPAVRALLCRTVHRRSCGRRHRGGDPRRGAASVDDDPARGRRRHEPPRSCSGTPTACTPRRARPARRSRAHRSRTVSERRPERSSASASTPRRSNRASR